MGGKGKVNVTPVAWLYGKLMVVLVRVQGITEGLMPVIGVVVPVTYLGHP